MIASFMLIIKMCHALQQQPEAEICKTTAPADLAALLWIDEDAFRGTSEQPVKVGLTHQ